MPKKKAAKKNSVKSSLPTARQLFQFRKDQLSKFEKPKFNLAERLQTDLKTNQAVVSLILGILIIVVLGVSIFNFLNKPQDNLGPSQQTVTQNKQGDVSKDSLPGQYTVKDGDTLFSIAQGYYGDGYQYPKIADANKMQNADLITAGQVIDIPKLETANQATQQSLPQDQTVSQTSGNSTQPVIGGTGGSVNETAWGERITTNTYTVQDGDWLSTISGRSYGDIYQFDKIAKANNITNPDKIEPGTVLQIPR